VDIRILCAVAALATGCVVDAEPPACRDPRSVPFTTERTETTCDDFIAPDLGACSQTMGTFDGESCVVEAEYFCGGGVRATVRFVFCGGEQASGTETFLRIEDGCRAQANLREVTPG